MTTAATVEKAILQEILVQDSEAPLQAIEFQDCTFAMNNFMFELAADGVDLGYTEVTNLGDLITIPQGAMNGLIKNVAFMLSVQFDVAPTQALIAQAGNGLRVMTKIAVQIPAQIFPDTLPVGSGNECNTSIRFYGNEQDAIFTESGNFIATESNTEV